MHRKHNGGEEFQLLSSPHADKRSVLELEIIRFDSYGSTNMFKIPSCAQQTSCIAEKWWSLHIVHAHVSRTSATRLV